MEEGRRILPVVVEDEDGSLEFMVVDLVEGYRFCPGPGPASASGSLEKELQALGPLSIKLSDCWLDCSDESIS